MKGIVWLGMCIMSIGIVSCIAIPVFLKSKRDGVKVEEPLILNERNSRGIFKRYYNGVEYILYRDNHGIVLLDKYE